jgi:hypothetical protein
MKIHHTVGVYPSGDMKHNGVSESHLFEHIQYNMKWRPGRALVVDGVCVYKGAVSDDVLNGAIKTIKSMKPIDRDTQPYH